jgi:hypothetical protein
VFAYKIDAAKESKAILQQAVETYKVEMSRIPHCLENRRTDGGKELYSPETLFFYFWYLFLLQAE